MSVCRRNGLLANLPPFGVSLLFLCIVSLCFQSLHLPYLDREFAPYLDRGAAKEVNGAKFPVFLSTKACSAFHTSWWQRFHHHKSFFNIFLHFRWLCSSSPKLALLQYFSQLWMTAPHPDHNIIVVVVVVVFLRCLLISSSKLYQYNILTFIYPCTTKAHLPQS